MRSRKPLYGFWNPTILVKRFLAYPVFCKKKQTYHSSKRSTIFETMAQEAQRYLQQGREQGAKKTARSGGATKFHHVDVLLLQALNPIPNPTSAID